MTKLTPDEVGQKYADLMVEVKLRLLEVERLLAEAHAGSSKVKLVPIAEYCYLQLRRITELVSLAILIAHNPTEAFRAGNLVGEYNPAKLLRALGKLSPAAFPQQGVIAVNPPYDRGFIAAPLHTTDVRDRLCEIYTTACDKLHAGALKSFLKRGTAYDFNEIEASTRYLAELLGEHIIYLPDDWIAYAKLNFEAQGVTVHWYPPKVWKETSD
ncbi:hypothetical protein [Sphingosinicella rhizophila]|uniref:AbiV family abortive infection protein n=1 Tax=Sphingosinicella rhizophila TaxID=3050082 RepID=A0ABU3Q3D6_9SPHN|nr:hypothetical protein [Sphingosinicella sp. GR2756]MDT9597920.1 hypothetical protein [Sphingosinicella sp. GR2756]